MRKVLVFALAASVSACSTGVSKLPGVNTASTGARTAPRAYIPPPQSARAGSGLEGVIGSSPSALVRRFGEPRLDLAEGDARKLQFRGGSCVLDVFLYPSATQSVPLATDVQARSRQDGSEVDPGACIREVEAQR
ncbi:MAG: hypothetical protein AAFW59_07125 [Pseudomonadota bacterium]